MALLRRRRKKAEPTGRRRLHDSSSPGSAFSYSNRRADVELADNTGRLSPRQAAQAAAGMRRRIRIVFPWRQRFGLVILIIASLICLISVLSLSTHVVIRAVDADTSQPQVREPSEYQAAAQRYLGSSLLNRNKITINTKGLRQALLNQFPELQDASIALPLIAHAPLVYIQPVRPAMILSSSTGDYIIGSDGKALIMAQNAPQSAQLGLPRIEDQSSVAPKLNQQVLAESQMYFIRSVLAQLAAKQVSVASLVLPSGTSELDVYLTGQPYFVKFNMQSGTATEQAGTLFATQAQLQKQSIAPVKYIDVRLDGRSYYQ